MKLTDEELKNMTIDLTNIEDPAVSLKDRILDVVTEEEIYGYYIPNFRVNKAIKSPIRLGDKPDKTPSFGVFETTDGKKSLVFKDHGTGKAGDCFTFVQLLLGISRSDAMKVVFSDLNVRSRRRMANLTDGKVIQLPASLSDTNAREAAVLASMEASSRGREPFAKDRNVYVDAQPYTATDYQYWTSYGISISTLADFDVLSARKVMLGIGQNAPVYHYNIQYPIYAIRFGAIAGIDLRYKLYCPTKPKGDRWFGNATGKDIFGLNQLCWKGNLLIITKSAKDVMCLAQMGLNAIAPQSEGTLISEVTMTQLERRFKSIVVMYDNDMAGIEGANKMYKAYPYVHLMFVKVAKCKDISDYVHRFNLQDGTAYMDKQLKQTLGHNLEWKDFTYKTRVIGN